MVDVQTPSNTNNTSAPVRPAAPVKAPSPPSKKKKGKKVLIIVVCVLAALIILVAGTILYTVNNTTSAPVNVSKQLVSDIQSKNATDAYNLLSPEAQKTVSSADFAKIVDQIGPILNGAPKMQSKEVSAATGDNQTAKVVYQIKGSDGVTYNFTVSLAKNNGKWLVQNFDSKQQ